MNSHSRTPSTRLLTLDDISNHFSVPLSDAANNLGVCVSVLKKICRDNGLDRWPYRRFLAGKSIEDIKRHAARERNKGLAEMAKAGRQSGSQHNNMENPKLQAVTSPQKLQQQGSKDVLSGGQHAILTPGLSKGLMGVDEFKYGFPSDGLSISTNKWWGSSQPDGFEGTDGDGAETDDGEQRFVEKEEGCGSLILVDSEITENGKLEGGVGAQGTGLLTNVRKRIAEEGQEALKLGLYRNFGVSKLVKQERALVLRVFGSTLQEQWMKSS